MIFPVLKPFEYSHIPLNGNTLRDKYPHVDFKDEDIEKYNYSSLIERQKFIIEEFLKQYDVKNLTLTISCDDAWTEKKHLFDVSVERRWSNLGFTGGVVINTLDKFGNFSLTPHLNNNYSIDIEVDPEPIKNFKFNPSGVLKNKLNISLEINKHLGVLDDFVVYQINEMFSRFNDEEIVYKHQNGYLYYTKDYCIEKAIKITKTRKKNETDPENDVTIDFVSKWYNVVSEFQKYKYQYDSVKAMPKTCRQITIKQMKYEFITFCKFVIANYDEINKTPEYCWDVHKHLNHVFKNENALVIVADRSHDGYQSHDHEHHFTQLNKPKSDIYIEYCKITKKDKFIGSYGSIDKIPSNIQEGIMEFLETLFGDDLELDIMDHDFDHFTYKLLDDLQDNEEYDGRDFFYYNQTYNFGKYKIDVKSSRYIKDQSICDLDVDFFDIYENHKNKK